MKKAPLRRLAVIILVMLPLASSCRKDPVGDRVCFPGVCYAVELAATPENRQRGLQNRAQLAPDKGMLFVFPVSSAYGFWMKETLIPLDMIWMDQNRRIIHIEEHVPPCESSPCPVYEPAEPALYVLEVNAGQVAEKRIKTGMTAVFHVFQKSTAE